MVSLLPFINNRHKVFFSNIYINTMKSFGRKSTFRGKDDRQMHKVKCADCGTTCEVPFKPTGNKPVYCRDCFGKGGRNPKNDGKGRPGMHRATCSACGESCEVPFKPTKDKQIYCSKCFGKGGSSSPREPEQSNKQLDDINRKLDKILSVLHRILPPEEITTIEPEKEAEAPKKTVKKAAPKKKSVKKKLKQAFLKN